LSELSPYFLERLRESDSALSRATARVADEAPGLREYWSVIRLHLALIVTITACVMLIVGIFVFTETPQYTSSSVILVEPQPPQVLDIKQLMVQSNDDIDHDYYKTQYALMRSRSLAAQVIHDQGLQDNPWFNGSRQPNGLLRGYWSSFKSWARGLSAEKADASARPTGTTADAPLGIPAVNSALIGTYLADLQIQPQLGTRLVTISFSTPDPKLSALLANAHAEAYVRQGMELTAQASQAAQQFLERKLVDLKERVERSEAALNSYRRDKGIVEFSTDGKNEILLKRLEDLNAALTEAQTRRIALESQADLISKKDYDALPEVVNNSMVHALKPELDGLEAQYASMASRYTLSYRPLAALKAKLDDTQARLSDTEAEIVKSVKLEFRAAVSREKELQAEVEREKAKALALNGASLKDAILARDVDSSRQLYESVLKRMNEMGVAAEAHSTNVSVVEMAVPPTSPSRPRKGLAIALSGVLALFTAIGVAFFLDYLDDTLKMPEEVERYLRLPTLAQVPNVTSLRNGNHPIELELSQARSKPSDSCDQPRNGKSVYGSHRDETRRQPALISVAVASRTIRSQVPFSRAVQQKSRRLSTLISAREAYRTIRSQILLSRAAAPPRTILITSAIAGEGKSITAVNTAIAFAHKGRRVLLIDGDLRKARCHELLNNDGSQGLSEVLTGQAQLDEVLSATAVTNLFLLIAGAVPPDPPELLGSPRMGEILSQLSALYDHIIIDTSPVMPISDTLVLSKYVEGVIVVVGRATPKHIVRRASLRISDTGAKILGVVLNQFTSYGHSSYYPYNGYNYSRYYSEGESSRRLSSETDDYGDMIFE
jgi:succinoglycan biosynthesis transport protein ExoP